MDTKEQQEIDAQLGIEYSGKTLGDVEIFLGRIQQHANEPITQILVMNGSRTIGGSALVPFKPGHGDRITVTFRLEPRV